MISRKPTLLGLAAVLAAALICLTGCRGNTPAPAPTASSVVVPPFGGEDQPPDEAIVEVDKAKGGSIALEDGALVTLPAGGLSEDATVSFRTATNPPAVPVPSSIVGRAYELEIDGSELTGAALLRLPLPPGVSSDQYEIAAYRWTGRLWERVTEREVSGGIQFGVSSPGTYALLGRWRLADATLALVKPDLTPGQQSIPLTVVGQYRFSAIPALQDGLVPARLVLKHDSSGGAGLVAGNPDLDATVDETTLYFKPDPAQSQGLIQFSQTFDLVPGVLDLDPGVSTRFYVVLTVEDAATPTRRISTGVEYTQILPIQIQNMEVVRPVVLQEDRVRLRWKITLNGLTFQTPEARSPNLALQPIIDQGGVGDYKVVLEVEHEGEWTPISNELSIQLALRATPTLPPGVTPTPTAALVAITTPGAIPSPAVPTRRPTPSGGGTQARVTATPEPTATETPVVTPTATRPDWASIFWADKYTLTPGECTNLHWNVENIISVLFNGQPATGSEVREICPTQTTTYTLRVTSSAGTQDRTVTIQISTTTEPAITFTADEMQITAGACTTLRWSATGIREVRLNGEGVAGVATKEVCLTQTTTYELAVLTLSGETVTKQLTLTVTSGSTNGATAVFYAEQYTLPANGCTTLHWHVQNIESVYLDGEGVAGVGTKQACPAAATQFYQLEINDTSGAVTLKDVVLTAGDPNVAANEVIAQGVVNSVTAQPDVSSIEYGEQPGYAVVIDGVRLLYSGTPGYSQANVTLNVPQTVIDLGDSSGLHWPVHSGQQVEFRASCDGPTCSINFTSDAYLYWRSD